MFLFFSYFRKLFGHKLSSTAAVISSKSSLWPVTKVQNREDVRHAALLESSAAPPWLPVVPPAFIQAEAAPRRRVGPGWAPASCWVARTADRSATTRRAGEAGRLGPGRHGERTGHSVSQSLEPAAAASSSQPGIADLPQSETPFTRFDFYAHLSTCLAVSVKHLALPASVRQPACCCCASPCPSRVPRTPISAPRIVRRPLPTPRHATAGSARPS